MHTKKRPATKTARTCAVLYSGPVDVHEAVGAGVVVPPNALPLQLFPGGLGHGDVVELEPQGTGLVVDECPVVAAGCLAFVHQHGMQVVGELQPSESS